MDGFTRLECAVLEAILRGQWPGDAARLGALLATARVTERDNTGHGFFTSFDVDRSLPPLFEAPLPDEGGWIDRLSASARVPALGEPDIMGFILWARDGWPNCLEGYQNGSEADLKAWDLALIEPGRTWSAAEFEAEEAVRH